MIRVVLTILLFQFIHAQPRCSTTGIPAQLPVLNYESVVLDASRYFMGPNLTLTLNTTSPLITLTPKYSIQQQKHNLNAILEITNANGMISMLGVSSVGRFYIYYAPVSNPNQLTAKQIPPTLERCSNHALSPDATSIAITCENTNRTKFIVAFSKLNEDDPWQIYLTPKYVGSSTRETEYLSNRHLAVVVTHPYNSYIEVWDSQYGRIVGIFDRTFFGLKYLNIVDIQLTGGNLFILDYETGIYELKFDFNTFHIIRQLQFTYYSKMAVHINSIVVSKKGSITEFGGKNTFKYEAAGFETINELIISDEYIIVYTASQVIAYLRGYHSPYFTIPTSNYLIWGTFLTDNQVIQTVSLYHTTQISIQSLTLSRPYIKIPQGTFNRTEVVVSAVSKLDDLEYRCKLNFTIIRTEQELMEIFDSQLSRNGTQHIYMNRPGRAEIDLTGYGVGPNLHYQVQKFAETVNVSTQIRKLKSIDNVQIEGIDKIKVRGTYFSDTCGLYRNQCPLAIDTNTLGMIRFYQCVIQTDTFKMARRINCSERYKQFKISQFTHYQLEQSPNELDFFYEISVGQDSQDQISIRKFKITTQFFSPIFSSRIKIDGPNTFGQNNITQLEFDEDNKLIFALMPRKKQIQIFRISQNSQEIQYKSIMKINKEGISDKYFAPSRFSLDSDGGLWVKSIDQMLVFDFRQIDILEKPIILSVVEISLAQVKDYDYDFEIVQQTKVSQLFTPTPDVSANTANQERNRKYLILYNSLDTLLVCPVSHLYEIDSKEIQPLPRYGFHVPQDKSQRIIQTLGNSQVFVTLMGFGETKVNMIYNLDSLSLASSYYTSIQTKIQAMPAYFYLSSSNPLVMFLQTIANSSVAKAYQICDKPKVLLTVSEMLGEKQTQQLILKVYNDKVQIRHSILLGISNTPEIMVKGSRYPYPNVRAYAMDVYIETDTVGWVSGNVLNISYACNHCEKPANEEDPYIDVKGKLWVKSDMTIAGGHDFEVISNRGYEVAIMRNNMIYVLDSSTNKIQGLHQLTQTATDTIMVFKVNWQHRLIAAAIRSENGDISIVVYTITNFKGFMTARMQLPSTVHYVLSMDYKANVIVVLDFSNVYIIGVDDFGNCYLVDYINEVEAGGSICWAELLDPVDGTYSLILTLCESGITYISFKLEENYSVLTILNKQELDLKESLNTANIRMPTDSSFLRTLTSRTDNSSKLNLMVIIRNFNSFEWLLILRNKVIISEAKINRVIHRYGDFGATEDVSYQENRRYMILTYFGLVQNKYQYIHAIYDTNDTHAGNQDEPYLNCYIMEALLAGINKRPQFAKNRTLLVLSDDANHLKTIDVHNKFRAIVHNQDRLQSQSLFMIPYSPVSSINIEIDVKGIDIVVWEIWEILLIILLTVIFLTIVGYLFRIFFTKYQQNKKLVPLLVDYAEYEEDLAQEFEEKKRASISLSDKSKDSQKKGKKEALQEMEDDDEDEGEDKKIGNINASERGSLNV